MTVQGKSVGNSIERKVNRDILYKLLWQKPTTKGRREVVHSFPSHISRKLLLEEHKLSKQLEKIEKERKQFLNRNSSERYLLQLSVRTGKALESRRSSRQCLVMNDNARCYFSSSDHGNGMLRKSWTSTTNGVFYQSGAKSVRQLQIKKVCLLKKMAERHRMVNSLPWKRNFDMPEVPPPSRSPSRTNIIWVRVRNSSGEMEIDGFLRTKKDFEELLPRDKDNIVPTKIEVRVPHEQDKADSLITKDRSTLKNRINDLKLNTDTVLGKPYEENCSVLENLDTDFEENMIGQKSLRADHEATQTSPIRTEVLIEQLAPTVKGLKVSPNEIRRSIPAKQKLEERPKTEVHEKYSRTGNDRSSIDNDNSCVFQDKVKTTTPGLKNESDVKSSRTDSGGDRRNIVGNSLDTVSDRSNIESGQKKIGSDLKKIESSRQKIRSAWKSGRSNNGSGRKSIGKVDRECIANDRTNIEKDLNEQNTTSGGKNAKTKRQSRKSSSTKINKSKSVQKFVQTKPNVQGICIFAKTFTITTESKGRTGKKTHENKKGLPAKPRSTTRLNDKKSATKLPRKSCSACTVMKTTANDGSSKEIKSKSDTATCSKVREAVTLHQGGSGVFSPGEKSQFPVSITLPSQTQLQNFDKVAKIKLRKTLAVKMRKHCYTGTWAFPPAQGRESKMEGKK